MIRLKHEGGRPDKNRRASGKATELESIGKPGDGSNGSYYEPAARMQAPSFVKKYRRRIQGFLWNRAEKQGVADYLKMMEAYKKNGASPFIGFRVMILNADKGTDRNPFW